jgi:nucleoside-triphosphatase THEP1
MIKKQTCGYLMKNKKFCERPLKKGTSADEPKKGCTRHYGKEPLPAIKKCTRVLKTGRICGKNTGDQVYEFCKTCYGILSNQQEAVEYREQKESDEWERIKKLLEAKELYKEIASDMLMNLFNLDRNSPNYDIIDYELDDIHLPDGRTIYGPCIMFPKEPFQCHNSHMGSGKTEQMIKFLSEYYGDKKILIISTKISMANDVFYKLKKALPNIQKYNPNTKYKTATQLVIQMESIHKTMLNYDVVIIDECFSLRYQCYSFDTHRKNITKNHKELTRLVQSCETFILMDADVNSRMLDYYIKIRNEKLNLYINNKSKLVKKPIVNIYTGNNTSGLYSDVQKVYDCLIAGEKIVYATNGQNKGNIILGMLKEMFKQNNEEMVPYVYYDKDHQFPSHIDENGTPYTVNEDFVKYSFVMYSPTISQGVDFCVPHFNRMFGYFTNKSNTVFEFIQMLGRVRILLDNEINIFCSSNISEKEYFDNEEEKALTTFKAIELETIKEFYTKRENISEKYLKDYLDTDYHHYIDEYVHVHYDFNGHFKQHFLLIEHERKLSSVSSEKGIYSLMKYKGYKVSRPVCLSHKSKELESCKLEISRLIQSEKYLKKVIKSSPLITEAQYQQLKQLGGKEGNSGLAIHAHKELEKEDISQLQKSEKKTFLIDKTLCQKARFKLSTKNQYVKIDKETNKISYNVSNKFMKNIMMNKFKHLSIIENVLYDKAVNKFINDNKLTFKELLSAITIYQISENKLNCDKQNKFILYRRYKLFEGLCKFINFNPYEEYCEENITPNIFNNIRKFYNGFCSELYYDKIETGTIADFNKIIKNIIGKWSKYKLYSERRQVNHKRIFYYRLVEPFGGFEKYIENCNTDFYYREICKIWSNHKEQKLNLDDPFYVDWNRFCLYSEESCANMIKKLQNPIGTDEIDVFDTSILSLY